MPNEFADRHSYMAQPRCYCCDRITDCYILETLELECDRLRDDPDVPYRWNKIAKIIHCIDEYNRAFADGHIQALSYPPCPR